MSDAQRILCDAVSDLGEAPVWSTDEAALYWVDMTHRIVWRHATTTGATRSYQMKGIPTALAPRAQGGLLVALRNGFAILDTVTNEETRIPVDIDFSRERFNDGTCDRRGRFFVGSLDKEWKDRLGGLWRLDPDLSLHHVDGDIVVGNGMAFGPDDRTMYFTDSHRNLVYAYDYDIETGAVSNRRVHLDFNGQVAHPDGCTIDSEGCLWIAEIRAGTIGRYAPDGRRIAEIPMSVSRVTSLTFGGQDLATLFITSMQYGLTDEERAAQPDAGRTFVARPGAKGLPEAKFAG